MASTRERSTKRQPNGEAAARKEERRLQRERAQRVDKGRVRSGLEIPRKLFHSSIGFAVIYQYVNHPSMDTVATSLAVALAIISTADVLRFNSPAFERFYERVLGYLMRESERHTVNGVVFYLVGVLTCFLFYPRDIAVLSAVMLSWCDTSASVIGRLLGRYTPSLPPPFSPRKSLAGTLGAIAVGSLASYVWWSKYAAMGDEADVSWTAARSVLRWRGTTPTLRKYITPLPNPNSTLSLRSLALLSGCMAGLAEAIDVYGLDDNLTLPVLFGLFLWATMWLLG